MESAKVEKREKAVTLTDITEQVRELVDFANLVRVEVESTYSYLHGSETAPASSPPEEVEPSAMIPRLKVTLLKLRNQLQDIQHANTAMDNYLR